MLTFNGNLKIHVSAQQSPSAFLLEVWDLWYLCNGCYADGRRFAAHQPA